MAGSTHPVAAVVFDVDGTLLDSAPGIVDGFAHALATVGSAVPDDVVLRSDLGPPVGEMMARYGVPTDRIADAVVAYRARYHAVGIGRAEPYDGVRELLAALDGVLPLATATAKRTDTATKILTRHHLDRHFAVIGGSSDTVTTKTAILAATLRRLGDPDPSTVIMVGDRASDLLAARACGTRSVGVSWGYGSRSELTAADPDHLVDHPAQILGLAH